MACRGVRFDWSSISGNPVNLLGLVAPRPTCQHESSEIAKAFDAPLMHQADPNGSANDHLKLLGDSRVRYGFHATVAEQLESDSHRPSIQARLDTTLDAPVIEQAPSYDDEP